MPSYYIHLRAGAETMERLKAGVPAGSPLSQNQANDLFDAAHKNLNYFAAGAYGPDLFFLLPDFKGDTGKGLLAVVDFVLKTWKVVDDDFMSRWETWMTPVLDDANTLANGISGGMLGEISQILNAVTGGLMNVGIGVIAQSTDIFGIFTSGVQTGYEENTFFWSDMFHYRKTYQFARTLYRNASQAEPDLVAKQKAFALGWISHCATDVAGHPFVNAKCGGPYRTHWQRHHLIENHVDAFVYRQKHPQPSTNYEALVTSALHFALAFQKGAAGSPDDAPKSNYDYFPLTEKNTSYPDGEKDADNAARKQVFDVDTEPLPEHICNLLIKTMEEVYNDPGPQVLRWDPKKHVGDSGRPTVEVLQEMYDLVFMYTKYVTSSGLSPRTPKPPDVITDHSLPQPPQMPDDSAGADPNDSYEFNLLDIVLAIIAYSIWLAEVAIWVATVLPSLLTDLLTWPLRELLYELLVVPAWDMYVLTRSMLVMEGFLSPRNDEISDGMVVLGKEAKGALIQLRADLDDQSGFAPPAALTEPSGLDSTRGAATNGFSLDPAYPRAVVTDLQPAYFAAAPIDSDIGPSEFVAPWRYPRHNMAGIATGWEAPRAHAGPYMQGKDACVLIGEMPGSDTARHKFEAATTPEDTEKASAILLPSGAHLGDPVSYGVYLIGQLTSASGNNIPDFNLDADRGYAYHCWDYLRHAPSLPPTPRSDLDKAYPDQWACTPKMETFLSGQLTEEQTGNIHAWYDYREPLTVPQRYDAADNPHHRSVYDPLKRIAHLYLPRGAKTGVEGEGIDLQVSEQEMKEVGMSPTGRLVKS